MFHDVKSDLDQQIQNQFAPHLDVRLPNHTECLYVIPSTICNLNCKFCAYPKTQISKQVMPFDLFTDVIDRGCEYGFSSFGLTPMLGEALTDTHFVKKLEYLEQHAGVSRYSFCTNFTIVNRPFLAALMRLRKLRWLSISVYGHDEESFSKVTQSSSDRFLDLLTNLHQLGRWPDIASRVELRIRSLGSFTQEQCHPRLKSILKDYAAKGVRIRIPHDRYSNWGGMITEDDVRDLGIRLKPAEAQPRKPCAYLFYKHTVLPDGRLNACYAEDGNATLVIGDLTRQSFREIYSIDNQVYLNLLMSHFQQRFNPVCAACTGFRNIDTYHYSYDDHDRPFYSLNEFLEQMSANARE